MQFLYFLLGVEVRIRILVLTWCNCISLAKEKGAVIMGVVGRDGGYAKESSDLTLVIPTIDESLVPLIPKDGRQLYGIY